jgi:fructose-specific phosphotransferase system IIC component
MRTIDMAGLLAGGLAGLLAGWLAGLLACWLAGWLQLRMLYMLYALGSLRRRTYGIGD